MNDAIENIISETISAASVPLSLLANVLDVYRSVLVIVGVFILVLGYALFVSKKAMLASLFSLIFAGLLFLMFPYWDSLASYFGAQTPISDFYIKGAVFIIIFLGVRLAIRKNVRGVYPDIKAKKWLEVIGLSLASLGLFLVYAYQFTSLGESYPLAPSISVFITAPQAFFLWIVAAFFAIYTFSRHS